MTRLLLMTMVLLPGLAVAGEIPQAVKAAIQAVVPDGADAVSESAIGGLYQVVIGPHVFYLSGDGKHLVRGELVEIESARNLTAPVRNRARAQMVESVGESNMIVFSAPAPKHIVTVFTDVDCGYCAKLHREMSDYLAAGISVRYMAFPRAGVPSESYQKMVSVWCADDPQKAMGEAKARRPIPQKTCPNPVADQYELGRQLGIRGTPTIVMETGEVVPGYMSAERLAGAIVESKSDTN